MISQRKLEANRLNLKKRKGLSPEGRERLREAALRRRLWQNSTGPRTAAGRVKSAANALRHGRETNAAREFRSDAFRYVRLIRRFRRNLCQPDPRINVGLIVSELSRLAEKLLLQQSEMPRSPQ